MGGGGGGVGLCGPNYSAFEPTLRNKPTIRHDFKQYNTHKLS